MSRVVVDIAPRYGAAKPSGARVGAATFRAPCQGRYTAHCLASPQFVGKNRTGRHRMIYSTLGEMMKRDIHALNIQAHTPDEIKLT